jgi:hypothetical protein
MANMRPSPHKNTSFWFMGDIITFIITGEDTQGVYSMIETTVPPLHDDVKTKGSTYLKVSFPTSMDRR